MKNKRKIWVRLGAFMAALICCVICVVPAYAEETETQTEQGDLIAEQAEKIEGYISSLGYGDLTLTAGEQLEIGQKTYADVQSYTWYSSSYAPVGVYHLGSSNVQSLYNSGGFTFVIRDSDGNVVLERDWATLFYSYTKYSNNKLTVEFLQNSSGSGGRLLIEYNDYHTVAGWTRVAFSTSTSYSTYYNIADGYSFEVMTWSTRKSLKAGDYAGYLTINPSQLLALNVSASNEEVYNQGYNTGYNEGYTFGYTTGNTEGEEYGYRYGHEEGFGQGLDQGYRTGYDDGMQQTSLIEGIKSLFRAPMEFIESVLDFEIFGIDLGDAVKALVSMMLLALVITVVWKAVK